MELRQKETVRQTPTDNKREKRVKYKFDLVGGGRHLDYYSDHGIGASGAFFFFLLCHGQTVHGMSQLFNIIVDLRRNDARTESRMSDSQRRSQHPLSRVTNPRR